MGWTGKGVCLLYLALMSVPTKYGLRFGWEGVGIEGDLVSDLRVRLGERLEAHPPVVCEPERRRERVGVSRCPKLSWRAQVEWHYSCCWRNPAPGGAFLDEL